MKAYPPDVPHLSTNPGKPGGPSWSPNPNPPIPPPAGAGSGGFQSFPNDGPPGLRDPVLQGRFGRGIPNNRQTLRGRTLFTVSVDRPSMLVPLDVVAAPIFYQCSERPPWQGLGTTAPSAASTNPLYKGERSMGNGICYFPTVGEWYLYYDVSAAAALQFLIVPCEDPGRASKYFAEPGCHTAVNTNLTGLANAVGTIAANRDRRAFFLQNLTGGTGVLRLGMGTAVNAASVGAPPAGRGFALSNLGIFQLSGESCYKGAITVVSEVAWEVEYCEFT